MHIHVLCDGKEAKYWLEPQVELAKNTGIPGAMGSGTFMITGTVPLIINK